MTSTGKCLAAERFFSAYSNIASTAIEPTRGRERLGDSELNKAGVRLYHRQIRDKMDVHNQRGAMRSYNEDVREIVGEAKYSDLSAFSDTTNLNL